MRRNIVVLLSTFSILATAVAMIACGSSSSSTKPCTGSYNIVGDWQGTASGSGTSDTFVGVINSSGDAAFFDGDANIVTLSGLTGACAVSEPLDFYASIESGQEQTTTGTFTGNVNSATSITGSDVSNGSTTNVGFSAYTPLTTETAFSGSDPMFVEGQAEDSAILTFGGTSSNITFTGSDGSGCTITGGLTQETVNSDLVNVYDVTFDVSVCEGSGNFTGVGFESPADLLNVDGGAENTYLYGILSSGSGAFVFEVFPPSVADKAASHTGHGKMALRGLFGTKASGTLIKHDRP